VKAHLQYDKSGLTYTDIFSTLAVKGLDAPDRLIKIGVVHDELNGNLEQQIRGFRREISITLKPGLSSTQTRFLEHWFDAETKRIIYGGIINTEGITDKELASQWLYECEHNREFEIKFFDSTVYALWEDVLRQGDELIYIKNNVVISQDSTEAAPESFITNTGKLAVMENGEAFPLFNSVTHSFFVEVFASNGAASHYPAKHSVNGDGNMVIATFAGSGFTPALDGNLYADFAIHEVVN
jgi:hypothetical protein